MRSLETELSRARADDVDQAAKIAQLSRELEAAHAERARVEAELARLRPKPKPKPEPEQRSEPKIRVILVVAAISSLQSRP